jgi:hypothetical protein
MMIARLILPLTEPLFDTFEATVKAASPGCTAHVAISRGAATVKLGWPGRFRRPTRRRTSLEAKVSISASGPLGCPDSDQRTSKATLYTDAPRVIAAVNARTTCNKLPTVSVHPSPTAARTAAIIEVAVTARQMRFASVATFKLKRRNTTTMKMECSSTIPAKAPIAAPRVPNRPTSQISNRSRSPRQHRLMVN